MNRIHRRQANQLSAALLMAMLFLAGAALSVQAGPLLPNQPPAESAQPPARPLEAVTISMVATTRASADGSTVFNGDRITYTLTVENSNATTATVTVENPLPNNVINGRTIYVFDDVACTPLANCFISKTAELVTVRDSLGLTTQIPITRTAAVTWQLNITPNTTVQLTVSGRVVCQAGGSTFQNQAAITQGGFQFTKLIPSTVQIAPPADIGRFAVSGTPELCSLNGPVGGTSDLDWGDFDNDGDLDVALGSYGPGVFVYRNNGGQFEFLWSDNTHPAEGVRWGNFNETTDSLELLISGEWDFIPSTLPDNSGYSFTGFNYLYEFDSANDNFVEYDTFETNDGSWRSEVADFTGDGKLDIVLFNYWGGCVRHLYINKGSGLFDRSDPATTTDSYCLDYNSGGFELGFSGAWGDYDNDGDPDLAVGYVDFSSSTYLRVYENDSGVFTGASVTVETLPAFGGGALAYPLDLAWGDYNRDGRLDLAAGFGDNFFPAEATRGGFKVYRNNPGGGFTQVTAISTTNAVGAVEWADFDGDGRPELAVAEFDAPAKIYDDPTGAGAFVLRATLGTSGNGATLAVRPIDYDNDGDIDLSMTNFESESWLFTNAAPSLDPRAVSLVGAFNAQEVASGKVTNNTYPDLLYGTGQTSKLYTNDGNGSFSAGPAFNPNPPAQSVALADADNDGDLDLYLGTDGQNLLYANQGGGNISTFPIWASDIFNDDTRDLEIADIDQDNSGRLDLLIGDVGADLLYVNQGTTYLTLPNWQSTETGATNSLDWTYFNNDILPDFVAAGTGVKAKIYTGNGYDAFTLSKTLPLAYNTTGVAWGDYDADGDMDLALANDGQASVIYRNDSGTFVLAWTAPVTQNSRSVAWGDWDNDGDLDLAIGNYGQKDRVYVNLGEHTVNKVNLVWLWEAQTAYKTTDLAWSDYDGDGDLDLVLSQDGGDPNGLYTNSYVNPAHLVSQFTPEIPLPQNPSYLTIKPGGPPNAIYERTTITDPNTLQVPLTLTVFDPDGTRSASPFSSRGDSVKVMGFQYSLNGGGQWFPATVTPTLSVITTERRGRSYTVTWLAGQDLSATDPRLAVSDQAKIMATVSRHNNQSLPFETASPIQKQATSAESSLFRVRNSGCIWPQDPLINASVSVISGSTPIDFTANVGNAKQVANQVFYNWNFGAEQTSAGQVVQDIIITETTRITLTVSQKAPDCPVSRPDFTVLTLAEPTLAVDTTVYLPLILKNFSLQPDLIGSFTVTPPNPGANQPVVVTAIITNQGTATADAFWVDFYINPTETPSVNRRWNDICQTVCKGIAWFVSAGLKPGSSVVVTSNSFPARYSDWDGSFPLGTNDLQMLVDSWNPGVATGGVVESNEANNVSQAPITVLGQKPGLTAPPTAPSVEIADRPPLPPGAAPAQPPKAPAPEPTPTPVPDIFSLNLTAASPGPVDGPRGEVRAGATHLSWEPAPPEEGVLGYRIFRSPKESLNFRLLAETPAGVTQYSDTTAACGYIYIVTAHGLGGDSPASTASYYSPACR